MSDHAEPLIIFIPGKNPKPASEQHRQQLFRCLSVGLARAGSEQVTAFNQHPRWFELLAWNELFYGHELDIQNELPWIDQMLETEGPSKKDQREAHAWKTRLAWVLYSLADRHPALIPMIANPAIRSTLQETMLYFKNVEDIGRRVRAMLQTRLVQAFDSGQPVLLIGHSMGSVIAYDTLWEMSHELGETRKLSLLLTLGSPLGLHFVQRRILGAERIGAEKYPTLIDRWVNISAMGELTALDREFAGDFHEMIELGLIESIQDHHKGIYNYYRDDLGLNVHRSYGYLVNPVTGGVVGDWLRRVLG